MYNSRFKTHLLSAFKSECNVFLIIHNHPSGKLAPNDVDRQITRKIKEASKILDINLLDHLIITAESYYSFADEGIL